MTKLLTQKDTSFDQCIKCTVCTVYCPIAKVFPDFPGPKQCGPDGERLRIKHPEFYDDILKYCTNCKRCETACPSGVRIGDIIAIARGNYDKLKWNPRTVRDFILGHTDLMGSLSSPIAPVINAVTQQPVIKKVMRKTIGIHDHKSLPTYSHGTFRSWYKKQVPDQSQFKRKVSYFHGCYVNYNHPQLGKDFITVMNAIGIGVLLLDKEKCCGVPLIANGFHAKAKKNALFNTKQLENALQQNSDTVLSTSSTCSFTLQQEYSHILGVHSDRVAKGVQYVTRFLLKEFMSGNVPEMKPLNKRIVYHTPCHLERSGNVIFTTELLKMIPGLEVIILDSDCCGSAGTYGFKEENYDISMSVGDDLFNKIKQHNADYVITDCETCKWQVEENTTTACIHPVSLLAEAVRG